MEISVRHNIDVAFQFNICFLPQSKGHTQYGHEVRSFSPVIDSTIPSGVCQVTSPPTCAALPVSDLPWELHGRHTYYITLELVGVQGLRKLVTSSQYVHQHGPPTGGVVVEIPVAADNGLVSMHNFFTSTCIRNNIRLFRVASDRHTYICI